MTIGGSMALIIIGAILRFAVTWTPANVDIQAIGTILMIGGVILLIFAIFARRARQARRKEAARVDEGRRYTEPPP